MMKEGLKKVSAAIGIAVVVLVVFFCMGRYGWKLFGFALCEGAGIERVEVEENEVHIVGFHPGPAPAGFCGYYAEEKDDTLYVGVHFSMIFGFFETGEIDIKIPTEGEISKVILKTGKHEYVLLERTEEGDFFRPYWEEEQPMGDEVVSEEEG